MSESDLVVVGTFLNRIDAQMAQSALEAADIESMVAGDDAGGVRPGLWMSGVRLLVRTADVAQAAAILQQSTKSP